MLSDQAREKGWVRDPTTPLHDAVTYHFWRDEQGRIVILGVNFEWASDVHYELAAPDLERLLEVLGVAEPRQEEPGVEELRFGVADFEDRLRDVTRHDGEFEKVLHAHGIEFRRASYR